MGNSRTKNTLLNTVGGMFVRVVTIFTAFITRTIFIRTLGIQYAGVQGVFTDVLTVLSFAEMGIGSAIIYALYKPIADNDEKQIGKLMNAYRKIYTIIAFVVLGAGLCLLPFLQYIITNVPDIVEDIRVIYLLYLINSASSYLLIYKSSFLTAAQKDYVISKMRIIISIAKAVGDCIILLVFKNFIIYLIFTIMIGICQNILISKEAEQEYPILKSKSNLLLEKEEKQKLFSDVRALFLYKVSGTVLDGTDSIVISTFISTALVGILGNYNLISNQVYSFIMQIFTATSASIGNLAAVGESEQQYLVFKKMTFLCFWIYCVCSTSLWVLFNPFMIVWQGEQYLFSAVIVALLVTEFYIKGMLSPISQFRTSNGLFVQGKYRPLIMAIINIVISIVLAQKIGVTGVIIGTVVSRISTQIWYDPYLIYKNIFKKSVKKYYLKYSIYFGITVTCCTVTQSLLCWFSISSAIGQVIVGAILCAIVPNTILFIFFHRAEEFRQLVTLTKNIIRRKV